MSRDADLNTWNSSMFLSVFKTELDVFWRRPQRTELSDGTHPSLCAQSCFEQLVIVKEHDKARQPSYSVVLFQFKFQLQYQSEETPKPWRVCLSCLEFNRPLEQLSTVLNSSTAQFTGYSFALLSFKDLSHQAFKLFLSAWFNCGRQFCTVLEKEFKILLWRGVLYIS